MQTRQTQAGRADHDELASIVRSHQEEIQEYRRVESQRVGCDIGWEWAAVEWMEQHHPGWRELLWTRLVRESTSAHFLRLATHESLN
jgi:hypothetical protein